MNSINNRVCGLHNIQIPATGMYGTDEAKDKVIAQFSKLANGNLLEFYDAMGNGYSLPE